MIQVEQGEIDSETDSEGRKRKGGTKGRSGCGGSKNTTLRHVDE